MKNDPSILTATEDFERLFRELFMGNPVPPKTPPWETELVIDGPPVVFAELPYFRFTRCSLEKLKELGEKYEYREGLYSAGDRSGKSRLGSVL